MTYQIGQYRGNLNGSVEPIADIEVGYKPAMINGGVDTGFRDVVITPAQTFQKGKDYYLTLKIPYDTNYEMELDIKLVKDIGNGVDSVYQFLKHIKIPAKGTGAQAYNVVLYEHPFTKEVVSEIPLDRTQILEGTTPQLNRLYFIDNKRGQITYWMYDESKSDFISIKNYNDLNVIASWRNNEIDETKEYPTCSFEMVFRPVEEGFSYIVLEMNRNAIDYNIQREDPITEESFYGRCVEIDKKFNFSAKAYRVVNLLENTLPHSPVIALSRIGVWGHTGLLLAINGEEIRIGPSGYYELDVLPINTLGVVAIGTEDRYTLDYAFEQVEENAVQTRKGEWHG